MSQDATHPNACLSLPSRSILAALKVPFGLKAGKMWSPRQVAPGLECGCVCPACNVPLVAKAADSNCRRPHFAHLAETDCRAGYETALHKKAKQLIDEHMALQLPAWDGELEMPNPPLLADCSGAMWPGGRVEFPTRSVVLTNIRLEESQGDYIPDVIAIDDQGDLLIEIRVSHAVDPLKRRRVQSEGRRLMEINLSSLDGDIVHDEARLTHAVLNDSSNREWLACPQATDVWRESYRTLKARVAQRNEDIAEEQRLAAEQFSAKQLLAEQERVKLAEQRAKRERFRDEERSRYIDALDALPGLVAVPHIDELLTTYALRDTDEAQHLINQIPEEPVKKVLRYWGPNAWIYQVHPTLWQAAAYHHFVLNQTSGSQFNQRDVARWVMQSFGRNEVLFSLFRAQYSFRDRARKAGIRKHRISFWAFTDIENLQIPNFYKPINSFIDRLMYLKVLQQVPDVLGQVRVVGTK